MKYKVNLEQGKMSESQVRDAIEKATQRARNIAAQKGEGDVSHEKMREKIISHAERDKKDGKI
ncbi:MAG: hypothetical protein E6R03_09670 [Hyphomicrobiaceae bacterium]|nr:MAG: hypothetical protein E6R03_09670 [Hyphomicrobiaceae bacterium]